MCVKTQRHENREQFRSKQVVKHVRTQGIYDMRLKKLTALGCHAKEMGVRPTRQ